MFPLSDIRDQSNMNRLPSAKQMVVTPIHRPPEARPSVERPNEILADRTVDGRKQSANV
jgi:hypothetical protein